MLNFLHPRGELHIARSPTSDLTATILDGPMTRRAAGVQQEDLAIKRGGIVSRETIAEAPACRHALDLPPLPESAIQKAVFQHLAARSAPYTFAFHVPNGGWRSPAEAAILKGQGVVPGVPDLIVIKEGLPFGLELKAQGGRVSDAQAEALEAMKAAGADVGVTHGLDAALAWLLARGILKGRTG
jgi:VRR-NUC domain